MTTKMMKIKIIILVGVLLTVSFGLKAQEEGVVIDKVVAVIGGNVILKSDFGGRNQNFSKLIQIILRSAKISERWKSNSVKKRVLRGLYFSKKTTFARFCCY